MTRPRTLAERAEYLSADEAAVALGMHARALKRRVNSGAMTAPAKYTESGRYLFTPEEVESAREELGLGKPLAILERANSVGENMTFRNYLRQATVPTAMMQHLAALQERLQDQLATPMLRDIAALQERLQDQLATPMLRDVAALQERLQQDIASPTMQHLAAIEKRLQSDIAHNYALAAESLASLAVAGQPIREVEETAPGQIPAFEEQESPIAEQAEATLTDVLAAVHETNRLLRELLATRVSS